MRGVDDRSRSSGTPSLAAAVSSTVARAEHALLVNHSKHVNSRAQSFQSPPSVGEPLSVEKVANEPLVNVVIEGRIRSLCNEC